MAIVRSALVDSLDGTVRIDANGEPVVDVDPLDGATLWLASDLVEHVPSGVRTTFHDLLDQHRSLDEVAVDWQSLTTVGGTDVRLIGSTGDGPHRLTGESTRRRIRFQHTVTLTNVFLIPTRRPRTRMAILDDLSGFEFEDLMEDVFRTLGYEDVRQTSKTADEGRDILVKTKGQSPNCGSTYASSMDGGFRAALVASRSCATLRTRSSVTNSLSSYRRYPASSS